jgi:hypothetical protein
MHALFRLGRVGVAGGGVSVVAVLGMTALGQESVAVAEIVFSLAALGFGFGLTTWSTLHLIGGTLEDMSGQLRVSEDFSATESRIAMAVLTVGNAGAMVGAVLTGVVLGSL